MQFDGRMDFIVDYFKWGELNRWYFIHRMSSEGSREAVSQFCPYFRRVFFTVVEQVFYGFRLIAVIAVRVVSFSRLEGFVVCPGCAIQDLKVCLFGFGRKAVHSYNVICIIKCFCRWVKDSIFSSGEIGGVVPRDASLIALFVFL